MDKSTREQLKKLIAQGVTAADIAEVAKELNENKKKAQEFETAREDLIADAIEYLKLIGLIDEKDNISKDVEYFRQALKVAENAIITGDASLLKPETIHKIAENTFGTNKTKTVDDIFEDWLKTL